MFCASFTVASDRNLDPGAIQAINAVLIIQNVRVILTVQNLCAKQLTTCQKKYNNLMEVFTYLNGRTSSGIEIESKRYLDSFKFRISYIMLGASDVSVLNSKMNNAWIKASGDYFIIIRGSRKSMALPSVSKLSVYRQNKLKLHGRWTILAQNYLVLTK